ncbi:hypothetical protein ACN1T9_004229 [Cronobacter sakazakii]|uniref:hypothetical protein n=1 Tax=Cronobacter sakazakii TaxID=28141 RepID=UPI001F30CB6B|nr:hypothetical protein [Cronobacter sakazakii]
MEISTLILKSLHFLLPAGFVAIIIHIIIKDKKAEKKEESYSERPSLYRCRTPERDTGYALARWHREHQIKIPVSAPEWGDDGSG